MAAVSLQGPAVRKTSCIDFTQETEGGRRKRVIVEGSLSSVGDAQRGQG